MNETSFWAHVGVLFVCVAILVACTKTPNDAGHGGHPVRLRPRFQV